jgi:hypothetical protein
MHSGQKVVSALGAMTLGITVLALADASEGGLIIRSTNASVDGTAVPEQGSVTLGSTLRTAASGSALVAFSLGTQVNLQENTSVSFRSEPGQLVAELSSGTLGAKSVGDETLIVRTHDLRIEPADGGKAIYVVAMHPDNTVIVSGRQGPVLITQRSSSQKFVLTEGYYAKVADAPQVSLPTGYPQQSTGVVPPGMANRTSTTQIKHPVSAGHGAKASSEPADMPPQGGGGQPPPLITKPPILFAMAAGAGVGIVFALEEVFADDEVPASPSAP